MGNGKQEPAIAFAEVSHPVRSSCPQHSSPAFDGIHDLLPGDEAIHTGRLPDRYTVEVTPGDEATMMRRLAEDASHIFLACGATDFRKQISGLVSIVSMQFKLDPFQGTCVFIFCNKKMDSKTRKNIWKHFWKMGVCRSQTTYVKQRSGHLPQKGGHGSLRILRKGIRRTRSSILW